MLTSIHGRSETRSYIKGVKGGQSDAFVNTGGGNPPPPSTIPLPMSAAMGLAGLAAGGVLR